MNKTIVSAALLVAAAGLSGCTAGYGYGAGGFGYASDYDDGYYDPYYGASSYGSSYYGSSYFGWYDGFYYPGTGYYVYDRRGTRHRWNDRYRKYWEARRGQHSGRENWSGYRRDDNRGRDWRDGARDGRGPGRDGRGWDRDGRQRDGDRVQRGDGEGRRWDRTRDAYQRNPAQGGVAVQPAPRPQRRPSVSPPTGQPRQAAPQVQRRPSARPPAPAVARQPRPARSPEQRANPAASPVRED